MLQLNTRSSILAKWPLLHTLLPFEHIYIALLSTILTYTLYPLANFKPRSNTVDCESHEIPERDTQTAPYVDTILSFLQDNRINDPPLPLSRNPPLHFPKRPQTGDRQPKVFHSNSHSRDCHLLLQEPALQIIAGARTCY